MSLFLSFVLRKRVENDSVSWTHSLSKSEIPLIICILCEAVNAWIFVFPAGGERERENVCVTKRLGFFFSFLF